LDRQYPCPAGSRLCRDGAPAPPCSPPEPACRPPAPAGRPSTPVRRSSTPAGRAKGTGGPARGCPLFPVGASAKLACRTEPPAPSPPPCPTRLVRPTTVKALIPRGSAPLGRFAHNPGSLQGSRDLLPDTL